MGKSNSLWNHLSLPRIRTVSLAVTLGSVFTSPSLSFLTAE